MLTTQNPSVVLLAERLSTFGYAMETFELAGTTYSRFIAPNKQVWLTPSATINYPFVSSSTRKISVHKDQAYALVKSMGVTVPVTQCVATTDYTPEDFVAILKLVPLIVKPNSASLSNGLTRSVNTFVELDEAIKAAFAFSDSVLVQQQVDGEEVRFVVIDGKVTAAILRQTPRVVGNGTQTLQQLIERENAERAAIDTPYVKYPALKPSLIETSDADLVSVPKKGEIVELARATMIKDGASIYNVSEEVDPSYVACVQQLANGLGNGFVVVDMFLEDYSKPMTSTNHVFIEFNSAPVLKLFYSCRDGKQYDVLHDLVPMIRRALEGDVSA